jgi:uncharacterized protein with von Willebrand factor type A (vWA) domain
LEHEPNPPRRQRPQLGRGPKVRAAVLAATLAELGEAGYAALSVDAVARRAGGRVFTPDIGRLGEYVVADYIRARRGRR